MNDGLKEREKQIELRDQLISDLHYIIDQQQRAIELLKAALESQKDNE